VHHAKGVGVLVCDHAKGLIEDNDISDNARAGVAILSGGNPVVRANTIHDGKDSGVLVSEKVRGRAALALHSRATHATPRHGHTAVMFFRLDG
jgi:parallel beta-helix repeat protein